MIMTKVIAINRRCRNMKSIFSRFLHVLCTLISSALSFCMKRYCLFRNVALSFSLKSYADDLLYEAETKSFCLGQRTGHETNVQMGPLRCLKSQWARIKAENSSTTTFEAEPGSEVGAGAKFEAIPEAKVGWGVDDVHDKCSARSR